MVGGDNLNSQACEPQKDALSCVERCAQTVGCKSVDWYQSKCCFKTYNSKDGTAPYENGGIDSWIEVSAPAPTPVSPPKCPEGSGKIFQTSGKYYKLNCNKMINEDNLNSQACEPQTNYLLCATRCAQVVGCKSVNWYQNKCCFKAYTSKDGTPPTEWTGGDSWVEVPDPSAAAAPVPAPAPAPVDGEKDHSCSAPGANGVIYTCPADDRKTYTAMNGKNYMLKCDYQSPGAPALKNTACKSIMDCAEQCSNEPASVICDWNENNCAMKKEYVEPFYKPGVNTWIDIDKKPSADPCFEDYPDEAQKLCSTECPTANGMIHDTPAGERFHIDCGRRHAVKWLYKDTQATLEACINTYGALLACHSVDWNTYTKVCYYGQHHGEPQMIAASYTSAHSLGCADAKYGGGGCDKGSRAKDEL